MTNDEIRKIIHESIANCRARDVTVREGSWGTINKGGGWMPVGSICPLGAVLVCGPPEVREKANKYFGSPFAAAQALGVSQSWVSGFVLAVDGTEPSLLNYERQEGAELGWEIRKFLHRGEK